MVFLSGSMPSAVIGFGSETRRTKSPRIGCHQALQRETKTALQPMSMGPFLRSTVRPSAAQLQRPLLLPTLLVENHRLFLGAISERSRTPTEAVFGAPASAVA